ncbi:pentapeptide repeat-containing protein [Paenarthrobacter sp. 2TAF44]|uniref:pentapeptide repeat-containing protein n=1 Tax=Paenarthrobacter sp. 2TAF44 TaxID=3233018 RepID=UPI003F985C19
MSTRDEASPYDPMTTGPALKKSNVVKKIGRWIARTRACLLIRSLWRRADPIFRACTLTVFLSLLVASLFYAVIRFIAPPDESKRLDPQYPIQFALWIAGGIGGVVALVVAYRRQKVTEENIFVERFGAAAAQLGSEDPAVRMAGVYAMAGVADEGTPAQRQQCVDVLCGYLRLPYNSDGDSTGIAQLVIKQPGQTPNGPSDETTIKYRLHDKEVRATIVRVLASHLRQGAAISWSLCNIDLSDAVLTDSDFSGCRFDGEARIAGATFSGHVSFSEATFSEDARFNGVKFSGEAWFREATFSGSARFDGATFSGGAWFSEATFSGHVSFSEATFSEAGFSKATFSGDAGFRKATFSGDAGFSEATFSEGARFSEATFSGDAWFSGANFSGDAGFSRATFSREAWFEEATFSGKAWFEEATFSGETRFDEATFSPFMFDEADFRSIDYGSTVVTFRKTNFGAGVIDFSTPRTWDLARRSTGTQGPPSRRISCLWTGPRRSLTRSPLSPSERDSRLKGKTSEYPGLVEGISRPGLECA